MRLRVNALRSVLLLFSLCVSLVLRAEAEDALQIGLTPAFLNERHALIADWRIYLEGKLKRPVNFILRDSYQSTLELLRQKRIDVAWLCDCPHVTANVDFTLLATPLFQGRPYYRSFLIVSDEDKSTRHIKDLNGKVFAYTDPYSNIGFLFPRYEIKLLGAEPERFFRRTFYTRSQRKSIEAVAEGVADAASVSSYIWGAMQHQSPALIAKVRVAERSKEYGFPPFVAARTFPAKDFLELQQALIEMASDKQGREVLNKMNLDGFIAPKDEIYQDVQDIVRFMQNK